MTPLVDNAAWARTNTCSVLWPVPVPDADEVRTAVTGHTKSAGGLLFDCLQRAMMADIEFLGVVDTGGDFGPEDLGWIALSRAGGRDGTSPIVEIVVARRGLAVIHSHALGDGTRSTQLVQEVLAAINLGAEVVTASARRDRVATIGDGALALVALWIRNPRHLVTVASSMRMRLRRRGSPAGLVRGGHPDSSDPDSSEQAGGDQIGGDEHLRLVMRRFDTASGTRVPSLCMAADLAGRLPERRDDTWAVLASLRQGSDRLTNSAGNIIGVLPVAGTDLVADTVPSPLERIKSGEVLFVAVAKAAVAAGRARRRRVGGKPASKDGKPGSADRKSAGTTVSWSDRGRQSAQVWSSVRWCAGAEDALRSAYVFTAPSKPGTVTINIVWIDGFCHVTITGRSDQIADFSAALAEFAIDNSWADNSWADGFGADNFLACPSAEPGTHVARGNDYGDS